MHARLTWRGPFLGFAARWKAPEEEGRRRGLLSCFGMGHSRTFKESLKALEADIQHANTLAAEFPKGYDGACLQMRLSYSAAAPLLLFLFSWTDCSFAGALGLLRILIYKVYMDGTTTMAVHERKASINQFYRFLYPALQQLSSGLSEYELACARAVCAEQYSARTSDGASTSGMLMSAADIEYEQECGICLEPSSKVALPGCNHAMCLDCYRDWHSRSQSCPFCRDSLKRVRSRDLWVFTDEEDLVDMGTVAKENLERFLLYVNKLPVLISDSVFTVYEDHVK
ncbi:hypothetical protein KFL_006180010 [Klebsormidium nitens]|uniref:RING-type domain-containing protein n=1 Tax=Klebsormidium nitens TaxID=105231 RepID=A0A1Y1IHD1_KLENI|nr:hypothetical protein KFL_006180010 [Klebsormidium nitens]|eukprot:GAQ90244.1 hypothetical protein KFL_006180010 [Klebsormidium nitens]